MVIVVELDQAFESNFSLAWLKPAELTIISFHRWADQVGDEDQLATLELRILGPYFHLAISIIIEETKDYQKGNDLVKKSRTTFFTFHFKFLRVINFICQLFIPIRVFETNIQNIFLVPHKNFFFKFLCKNNLIIPIKT